MLSGFFVEGGAAASGWTSYAPLAVLASRGQDFWLVGIVLLGVSAMLNSLNVIATDRAAARRRAVRSCGCRSSSGHS